MPWHQGTALVLCDLEWHDGTPVVASPRQILRRQLDRLAERGLVAYAGTELEFIVFRDTYEDGVAQAATAASSPANQYNVDYSLLGTARVEPLLRRIRNDMAGAGLVRRVGQGRVQPRPARDRLPLRRRARPPATTTSLYKTGAKEIAAQEGMSLTFMAKYDEREGNSCHIHLSLRSHRRRSRCWPATARPHGFSPLMEHFLAGQLACLEELTLLLAPNVNSYKRFAEGSFAPTAVAWGRDNRTCALRVVGHGQSLRVENRVPGGDVNPYLAVAALIAAGLHGIDNELPLEPELAGNAYASDKPRVPATLRDAAAALRRAASWPGRRSATTSSTTTCNAARVELAAFDAAVTDWERVRGFERL